jgi:hypothetical protein
MLEETESIRGTDRGDRLPQRFDERLTYADCGLAQKSLDLGEGRVPHGSRGQGNPRQRSITPQLDAPFGGVRNEGHEFWRGCTSCGAQSLRRCCDVHA